VAKTVSKSFCIQFKRMNLNCVLGKDGRRIKEFIAWGVKMPIYEYECKSCRQIQEILQGSAEEPALKCAHCGSTDFKRLISAAFVSTGAFAHKGKTCCGRDERCETPPCSINDTCRQEAIV
jgi:putative FmdB family regulatory protein